MANKKRATKKRPHRIELVGTGCQAPYGIGEIIETYANTDAGIKKAKKYALDWYNPPDIRIGKENYSYYAGEWIDYYGDRV